MTDHLPLLTIGVLSWNRLHYLRATLESARRCIKYPNIQWIVLDNCSIEPGLPEYLKSLDWVDELIFMDSTHVSAMNEIISRARGDVILMWPDDMQFVVEGDWMRDCIELLMANHWIGSLSLNFQRRTTIQQIWGKKWLTWKGIKEAFGEIRQFGAKYRFQKKIVSSRGFPIRSYGLKVDGIIGAGIASLTRINVWKNLGPWKSDSGGQRNIVDSSAGGESEMLTRWRSARIPYQRALPILPVSADILTDDLGTKAKVRGNKRYGVYKSPSKDEFYYRIYKQEEVADRLANELPVAFEDVVQSIGYELPMDDKGNLIKGGLNTSVITPIV